MQHSYGFKMKALRFYLGSDARLNSAIVERREALLISDITHPPADVLQQLAVSQAHGHV